MCGVNQCAPIVSELVGVQMAVGVDQHMQCNSGVASPASDAPQLDFR